MLAIENWYKLMLLQNTVKNKWMFSVLNRIRVLNISKLTCINDTTLTVIAKYLKNLETLNVSFCRKVTGYGIRLVHFSFLHFCYFENKQKYFLTFLTNLVLTKSCLLKMTKYNLSWLLVQKQIGFFFAQNLKFCKYNPIYSELKC